MCGITGKVYFKSQAVAVDDIRKMNRALSHRGPDDEGVYISPHQTVGLGHRRLSIIDLSAAGHQPMRYRDRYVITFNGEIYNYQELRARLKQQGYHFTSHTDTEVIVALYAACGADVVRHLRGMFAFVIYDEREQRLFCARDRLGKKPFKYYLDANVFMFASEIKALLTQPDVETHPDLTAINQYLTWQYVPAPRTGFLNIHKLPPAHTLELNVVTGHCRILRYWSLSYAPTTDLTDEGWIHEVRETLTDAVTCRLVSDVPVGAFLSGGVDSAAVVAVMATQSRQPIKTFSIGFKDAVHDETAAARLVAERYMTDHTELIIKPNAEEIVNLLAAQFDEPFADSSAIPTYYVSRLARQRVAVVLTGDGGDELFAGYRHYIAHRLADRLAHVPGARAFASSTAPYLSPRWRRFATSLPEAPDRRHITYNAYFTDAMKRSLYAGDFTNYVGSAVAEWPAPGAGVDPVTAALAYDTLTYLPDDILSKVDMMSMAVSLEARSPLLDHSMVSLAAHIPVNLKLQGWKQSKYIWKQAVRDLVPAPLLQRPKQGFTVPLSSWLKDPLRELLVTTLTAPRAQQRGLFRSREIQHLIAAHTAGRSDLARPLWALLTLELWFKTYIDGS